MTALMDESVAALSDWMPCAPVATYVVRVAISMYHDLVKTITITIPEELDERAAAEARRHGISKSELIRRGLDAVLPGEDTADVPPDPWRSLAGFGSPGLSVEPDEIDDVVYGA